MCPWARRSQCLCGDVPAAAASSAVSSHHLCLKLCRALAPMGAPWLPVPRGGTGLHCSPCTSEGAAFGWTRDFLQRWVFCQCCWCWLQGGRWLQPSPPHLSSPLSVGLGKCQLLLAPGLSASWPQPTPAHPCSRSSMEHGWVNTSLLWCDSGCSVTGAKMAVPSHPDLSLAALTLQGCPWVLGSTCRAGQAGAPAAAAVQKASSEPFLPKAHCCQHSQGVPAPSQRRMLHVQIWISTQTHLHMHKFCCGRAGPFAGLSPLITLQDVDG